MDKITGFIEGHIAPVANGLAKNRYIKAIQNTFMTLIPFFTIGSFALIIIEPPVDYTTLEAGPLQAFSRDGPVSPRCWRHRSARSTRSRWASWACGRQSACRTSSPGTTR